MGRLIIVDHHTCVFRSIIVCFNPYRFDLSQDTGEAWHPPCFINEGPDGRYITETKNIWGIDPFAEDMMSIEIESLYLKVINPQNHHFLASLEAGKTYVLLPMSWSHKNGSYSVNQHLNLARLWESRQFTGKFSARAALVLFEIIDNDLGWRIDYQKGSGVFSVKG